MGCDPREPNGHRVTMRSLLGHLSESIPVRNLVLQDLQSRGLYTRPTSRHEGRMIDKLSARDDYDGSVSTEHAIARFLIPALACKGWALFLESDMLVRHDLVNLFNSLDSSKALFCVKHDYKPTATRKMDGQMQTIYPRKNWSSLMAFNCDHESNRSLSLHDVNTLPGRDLHRFCWLSDDQIGDLDVSWNWLAGVSDPYIDPKIVHFTEGLPDMRGYENAPYAEEWRAELARLAA